MDPNLLVPKVEAQLEDSSNSSGPSSPTEPEQSGHHLLENLKIFLEKETHQNQELRLRLQSKEEVIADHSKNIDQLTGHISVIQSELDTERKRRLDAEHKLSQMASDIQNQKLKLDIERRRRFEAEKGHNKLGRLMLTGMRMTLLRSPSGSSPGEENHQTVTETELAEVMKLLGSQRGTSTEAGPSPVYGSQQEVVQAVVPAQDQRKPESLKRKPSSEQVPTNSKRRHEAIEPVKQIPPNSKVVEEPHVIPKTPSNPAKAKAPSENLDPTPIPPTTLRITEVTNQVAVALPPLVFQLQSKHIQVGTFADGKPQILTNDCGVKSTPFIVGLTKQGTLDYGSRVSTAISQKGDMSIYKRHWWVANHFIRSESKFWMEKIKLANNGESCRLTVELLIAFVLKRLKHYVETSMKGTFSTAVITVPFWYCSTHRIQVKDGARLAGFSEVVLVNESSAAVFSPPIRNASSGVSSTTVLVLAENGDKIDALVYSYNVYSSGAKRLIMIGHSGHYNLKVKVGESSTAQEDAAEGVRKICREVVEQGQDPKYSSSALDTRDGWTCIIISESIKWRGLLQTIGEEFVNKSGVHIQENAVLLGAAVLSQKPSDIREMVSDRLAYDVIHNNCNGGDDDWLAEPPVIPKQDVLPSRSKVTSHSFVGPVGQAKFCQMVMDRPVVIFEVGINPNIPSKQRVSVTLTVSNDGIVEFKNVTFVSNYRNTSESREAEGNDCSWKKPNLTKEQFLKLNGLMEKLI